MEEKKESNEKNAELEGVELRQEIERIRRRHKVLKIVTVLLGFFFVVVLLVVGFVYRKISDFKALTDEMPKSFSEPIPVPPNASVTVSPNPVFGGIPASSAGSSLTTFIGSGAGGEAGLAVPDAQGMLRAASKYADRPIVKDFMAELNKNPDFKRVMGDKSLNDPAAVLNSVKSMKGLQVMVAKFAVRRDFMPFMMELMNDPQLKPVLSQLPSGGMGYAAQLMQAMPVSQTSSPQSVVAGDMPEPRATEEEAEIRLEPSAVINVPKSAGTPLRSKAPPPVD